MIHVAVNQLHSDAVVHVNDDDQYQYLERRPNKKTRHLCLKGRNMTVWSLISHMETHGMTADEVAADFHLPVEAVQEARLYFERNQASILEENEEWGRELGLVKTIAPPPVSRHVVDA